MLKVRGFPCLISSILKKPKKSFLKISIYFLNLYFSHLEYNVIGNIHGIPGIFVDMDTGDVTDAINSNTYYVKTLEKEESMSGVASNLCIDAGLSLDNNVTLPDDSLFETPDVGAEPTASGAPTLIAGEIQN